MSGAHSNSHGNKACDHQLVTAMVVTTLVTGVETSRIEAAAAPPLPRLRGRCPLIHGDSVAQSYRTVDATAPVQHYPLLSTGLSTGRDSTEPLLTA